MSRRILYLTLLLALATLWPVGAQASPTYQGSVVLVRVCYDRFSCDFPNDTNSELTTLEPYIEHVLANEWHHAADLEALKAGAGVKQITVQYKIDSGAWQNHTTVNGAGPHTMLFTRSRYNRGHTYYFRTQATDQVGLTEAVGGADFSIYIAPNADPSGLVDIWLPVIFK